MAGIEVFATARRYVLKLGHLGGLERVMYRFMPVRLVLLHGEDKVSTFGDDPLGNDFLTSHGIDGDDASLKFQPLEQLWDGRVLIGFLRGCDLP